ncbi:MAG: S8 family serine peptidase, partial [Chitinophagales bacterium]
MKLRCFFIATIVMLLQQHNLFSQTSTYHRYIVEFKDKQDNPFSVSDPAAFLSQRAIDRRNRYDIPITENDLPVNPAYVQQVIDIGVKLLNQSKWLNSISIETDDSLMLAAVMALPFVKSSYPIAVRISNLKRNLKSATGSGDLKLSSDNVLDYGKAANQIEMLHGNVLHQQGYKGEGIVIAVMDVGFDNAFNLRVFDSLFQQERVLGTWNFVDLNDSVFHGGGHGTSVLSTISSNLPGTMIGTAPGASVYLFVTEDGFSEYPIEEHNWAAAAEKADSLGADMITTSLGYSEFQDASFDHTYAQLDGNTTMITRAADFAASKGMIVCNSAGNEGKHDWFYIVAPADADSILTVGAVDSLGLVTSLSSHGPASDGDIKPNVVAQGIRATVVEPYSGIIVTVNGTSLSN